MRILVFRFVFPFLLIAFATCFYIDKQNRCTQLGIEVSQLAKEINSLKQTNEQLWYSIKCFESPDHLLELTSLPDYDHLEFPAEKDVLTIKLKGVAFPYSQPIEPLDTSNNSQAGLVFATKR